MTLHYRRALLKISGEALAGPRGYGLDLETVRWIAGQIGQAVRQGNELGLVVGGGNILRGADAASIGVQHLVGDEMGMVATVLNAMALRGALEAAGLNSPVLSAFPVGRFVETFQREKALHHIQRGAVVIFAGGTGNPCFTTDSAAALRAVEIQADVLIKCTQVRGVFDKDPKKYPDAVFLESIHARELLERRLAVIDAAAADILARNDIPAIVLNLHEDGNMARALAGEKVGTLVYCDGHVSDP